MASRSRSRSRSPRGRAETAGSKRNKGNRRYRNKADGETLNTATQAARQRQQLLQLEDEILQRIQVTVQQKFDEAIQSEAVQLRIQARLKEERARLEAEVTAQIESERRALLERKRREADEARRRQEELDKLLEENRRKVEEAQRRAAEERQRREEEFTAEVQARVWGRK